MVSVAVLKDKDPWAFDFYNSEIFKLVIVIQLPIIMAIYFIWLNR